MNKLLAVLPLRSGSQRIEDKNIRVVGYYPLFVHVVRTVLSVNMIEKIIISTDSIKYEEIIDRYFSREDKVEVIIRPDIMSGADVKTEDVMMHVIKSMNDRELYENLVLVQATTPMTKAGDLESAIFRI